MKRRSVATETHRAASVLAAAHLRSTPQVTLYGDSGWRAVACADDRGGDQATAVGKTVGREGAAAHLAEEAALPRMVFFQGFQVQKALQGQPSAAK